MRKNTAVGFSMGTNLDPELGGSLGAKMNNPGDLQSTNGFTD